MTPRQGTARSSRDRARACAPPRNLRTPVRRATLTGCPHHTTSGAAASTPEAAHCASGQIANQYPTSTTRCARPDRPVRGLSARRVVRSAGRQGSKQPLRLSASGEVVPHRRRLPPSAGWADRIRLPAIPNLRSARRWSDLSATTTSSDRGGPLDRREENRAALAVADARSNRGLEELRNKRAWCCAGSVPVHVVRPPLDMWSSCPSCILYDGPTTKVVTAYDRGGPEFADRCRSHPYLGGDVPL